MIRSLALLALGIACAHRPSAVGGDVAVDPVSATVDGRTYHGAAVSRFDPEFSLLWYSIVYTGTPPDPEEIRRTYVARQMFAKSDKTIVAFELLTSALYITPTTIRAASEEAARAQLLGEIAPRKIASSYPAVPVLPTDTISIDIYAALGYDFTDGTFHELPQTKLLSVRFEQGEWHLEIRNRRGERRVLRLDRKFKPLNRVLPDGVARSKMTDNLRE